MGQLMGFAGLAAGAFQAASQIQQGRIDAANMRLEAARDENEATLAEALAQQQAAQERRRAKLLRSRALAVAGASGAGMSGDPTVDKILSDIESEGELRALTSLWEGDYLADALRTGAEVKRRTAVAHKAAATMNAIGSMAGGASNTMSFYGKYG